MKNEEEDKKPAFKVFKKPKVDYSYDIYLNSTVDEDEEYTELKHTLQSMSDDDRVTFHLANYGGDCHGLVGLISAIKSCKANVFMEVEAPCYSAGATLALVGDGLIMHDFTFLMFHNYSGGTSGKGGEMDLYNTNTKRWIHTYFRKLHRPFLTTAECNAIEKDQDIYVHFDDADLMDRGKRHFKMGGNSNGK